MVAALPPRELWVKYNMLTGLLAPITAARFLIKNKGLIKYFVIPFAINIFIFSFFLYYAINWLPEIMQSLLPESNSGFIRILYYPLIAVLWGLILLISVSCFSILGNIIASPFNDLLTQEVESLVLGTSPAESSFSLKDLYKIPRGILEELKRIGFASFIFIIFLPLNLVPLVGQILYLFLNSIVLAIFLGLEFFSYSLDRRDYSFKQKLRFIKDNFFNVMGVGTSAWILLMIPFINFSILPLTAIGATLCFCKRIKKKPIF